MAGHLHAGNAAINGIEAPLGYYHLFTGNREPVPYQEMEKYIDTLGNPWNIVDPGLMLKAFPCSKISHFGVDIALQLREKHSIDWTQIAEIEFRIPPILQRIVSYSEPRTGIEAKFSPGYCTCRALIYGSIKIADFSNEKVMDPLIRQLMKKIKWVVIDQEHGKWPFGFQELVVKMKDGNVISRRVTHPKGEPQNPQTEEDSVAKYDDCASHANYDYQTATQIRELILNLENIGSISELTKLFLNN